MDMRLWDRREKGGPPFDSAQWPPLVCWLWEALFEMLISKKIGRKFCLRPHLSTCQRRYRHFLPSLTATPINFPRFASERFEECPLRGGNP